MSQLRISRREFLRMSTLTATGALLAACGQQKQVSTPTQESGEISEMPPEQEPVTIKWWDFPEQWAAPGSAERPNAWNEEMAKKYMAENPKTKVEFTGISWDDGPQKLNVAIAAGQGPDITYAYPALFGTMLSLNALADITDYADAMPDKNDFYQFGWDFVTADNRKYAWPWYFGSESEWAINKTVVQEAGAEDLLPQAPEYGWSIDQMLALYQKCTFTRDNGDQVWGNVIYANEQQGINLWPMYTYAYAFGAYLYDEHERKSHFGGEQGVKTFQLMYDLVNKYKVSPPGAAGLTSKDGQELWNRKQETVQTFNGVQLQIGLDKALEAGTIQAPFEVLPILPPFDEGVEKKVSGGIWVLMDYAQKEKSKLDVVVEFTQWLLNPTNMEVFSQLANLCARISTTEKLTAGDALSQWRIKYVLPYMMTYSKAKEDFQIDDAWMQAVQSMLEDKQTPAEAAMSFQEAADALLQGG
jgi:ABC-type glycerol-3-phosphate transport system substrate-binding protein